MNKGIGSVEGVLEKEMIVDGVHYLGTIDFVCFVIYIQLSRMQKTK